MNKILFVILHGSVYKNRYDNIIKTWGKNVDCIFYSDYEDINKNIFKVSDRKDYNSNEEKHINSLSFVYNNFKNYEWFFFCDDDTFVNTDNLFNFLNDADKNYIHGTVLKGTYKNNLNLEYCSGGAGYLIHINILKIISENIKILNTGYSDVTLGLFLKENNIKHKHSDYFNTQPPNFYKINTLDTKKYITFHYIKTMEEMQTLYLNS
jgi:hypothetical protein